MLDRRRLGILALLLALAVPAAAQPRNTFAPLAVKYDLDTPASVEIVAEVNLTNTTLTLAAQPTTPSLIVFTIVDTTGSITDGDITVTGVDSHGTTRVEVLDASAGAGTYTTSFRYDAVATAVTTDFATLGGGGDETIAAATSESATYCRLVGTSGPFSSPRSSSIAIETSGSSTTLTESVASSGPFAAVAVGDLILVREPGSNVRQVLAVDAKAGADEITVDSLVDLGTTGVDWQYRTLECGGGLNDGWVDTARFQETLVCVEPLQGSSTGALNWWIEVKSAAEGAGPVQAYPDNSTTKPAVVAPAGVGYDYGQCVNVTTPHDRLRVGLGFATGGDDGTDTGLLKERITVSITGRQ